MSGSIVSGSNKPDQGGSKDGESKPKFSEETTITANRENKGKGDEKEKTRDEKDVPSTSFLSLFRYSTLSDKIIILIGCFCASISGATNPGITVLLGWIIQSFVDFETYKDNICETTNINETFSNTTTRRFEEDVFVDDFIQKSLLFSFAMVGVSICQFLLSFVIVFTLSWTAENQALRIRKEFMRAVLRQDISWYDTNETGDFASRITSDLIRIQDGIGEKVGVCIYFYSTTIISLMVAMYFGWQLTLVILSILPVVLVPLIIIAKIQTKISGKDLSAYGRAGAIAEEVFSSIRTVASFNGEMKEIKRYGQELLTAKKNAIKRGLLTSISMTIVWFCIYASYALAFWYGSKLVLESRCTAEEYRSSDLVIVFFSILVAALFVGQTGPYMEAFSMAKGAASQVYFIISRVPKIDSSSQSGSKPNEFVGHVKFVNVKFRYPSRKYVQVLQGLNFAAKPGETIALVGSSGCGKSTVIQLLQRFYDSEEGEILIDGLNIKEYHLGYLRNHIGVVGQEPILFATSIYENIKYGYPDAQEDDIVNAAKTANAHDFVSKLPQGYQTRVGQRGTQLSGGQKQRIAIARALVRNPKILLLDEATSALDTESESIVQAALDKAGEGRTTIIVAHRLSTIRNADKIVAIEKGRVKEVGTHEELMRAKGIYYELVKAKDTKKLAYNDEEEIEDLDDFDPEENVDKKWPRPNVLSMRRISTTSLSSVGSVDSTSQVPPHHPPMLSSQSISYSMSQEEFAEILHRSKKEGKEMQELPKGRLVDLMKPEWKYTAVGCVASILMGLSIPVYGIIFGNILTALNKDASVAQKETNMYCLFFLGMGVAAGLAVFLQTFMFTVSGENLTSRLREQLFKTIITQATGSRIATILQAMTTLVTAIVIGLIFNYKIGLVVLAFIPLVLAATYFESRIVAGQLINEKKAYEDATSIAVEGIENIRTLTSLHLEGIFFKNYSAALIKPHKGSRKKSYLRGLSFGISQSMPNIAYGIAMYYGSVLITKGELTYGDLFKITESVILGTMMIGMAVAFAPDYQRAKIAAWRIFKLLDLKSAIDPFSVEGTKPLWRIKGDVKFKNVYFRYPTRRNIQILRGISLNVSAGQTVALVGSSGCGKSTCVQLLQRFYDAEKGEMSLDDVNIRQLNLGWLRSQIGIVSQEPVLFGYSIAENIAYGDNSREVSMEEVIDAAIKANIHGFVSQLPLGYNTNVGDRGTQLSGGQKQRIAIARALVRNPGILLLDEATSALDTESENIVQEALDNASRGRTCIVIAHRLSTIQNADKIVVIHRGKVVEQGNHFQLLAQEGFYKKLHSLQSGGHNHY